MKNYFYPILFLFFQFSCIAQMTNKVLIIGIDGCRSDALVVANTPNIDALIANSTYSFDAFNEGITSSGPGWSAMLTGVWGDKHGVSDNSFSGNNYANFPHFFQRIEEFDSNLHTASICQWGPINDFIVLDHADYKLNVASGEAVGIEAFNYLSNEDPDALFLHFDDVDHAGHSAGFHPSVPEYLAAIEAVDEDIANVLFALYDRPTYDEENWLILLSTDHGGDGFSHGGNSLGERRIFVIASGDAIENQEIKADSTVAMVENCLGATEELFFNGLDDNIAIPPNQLFDFGAEQDFTIECRVRTSEPNDVAIVSNKDWDSGLNKGFVISFKYPSGPEWKVNIGDGTNRADINTGGLIADNEWHTLSATFDRDGFLKMYEDGILIDSTDISFIGDIDTGLDLHFGGDGFNAYNYNGAIAEVRIWDSVLDGNTINDWHCTSLENAHPNYNNLLGYWPMSEDNGNNMVLDFSPNANHGTINGAVWEDNINVTYDFSNTPRITDIAINALAHLCIPLNPDWQIDGQILGNVGEHCTTGTENIEAINIGHLNVSPNPGKGEFQIYFELNKKMNIQVDLLDANGRLLSQILETEKMKGAHQLNWSGSHLNAGVYFIQLKSDFGNSVQRFVVIP